MRALCFVLALLLSPLASADSLVIEHVTVIDATGAPEQPDMAVVIEREHLRTHRLRPINGLISAPFDVHPASITAAYRR
jgi:hypothetical protein